MPDNVQSAMLDILKRIQTDVAEMKGRMAGVESRLGGVEGRLDRVETVLRKQRRDYAGMLVMMKATAGDFDERVSELEAQMRDR